MANNESRAPELDELEVSVFGPGYGEAIAIHAGDGTWFLVDSCIGPESGLPASLHYLTDLGVDTAAAVRLVVATHWHDDHVRGLGAIIEKCTSADLAISSALRTDEFLKLVAVHSNQVMRSGSGMHEFVTVFQHLESRKRTGARFNPPKFALMDRVLYRDQIQLPSGITEAKVISLSPSDASILASKIGFGRLLPNPGDEKMRVTPLTPNHTSVALWIQIGMHTLLLGADLENTNDPTTGWSVILSDSTAISEKAEVFKISHHGSENAHHDDVWSDLLVANPYSVVTPFRRGSLALPSTTDIHRITSLTSHAFATAPARSKKERWSRGVVRDLVEQSTKTMNRVAFGWGQVRLRRKIDEADSDWRIALFGDAYPLSPR